LILYLQFVHHLLHVERWTLLFNLRALGLRINFAGEGHDSPLHAVSDALLQSVFKESRIQIPIDRLVQIRIHSLGVAFRSRRQHGNLIRDDLSACV
jgi:hypothetical protein